MTQPTGTIAVGQTIAHRAGYALITLTRTGLTYVVDTYAGPTRLDEWCRAYATEPEARQAARHAAVAFAAHGTDTAIEARRVALTFEVRDLLNARRLDRVRLAAVEAELDSLATLADLAVRQRLTADLAAA
jgi:hypothetical protein